MGSNSESNKNHDDSKNLDHVKKSLQVMSNEDLNSTKGGKRPSNNKWNFILGGPTPQ